MEPSNASDLALLLTSASKAQQQHGEIPHITLPDGFRLESIEHLLPTPQRARGTFETTDRESWIEYVELFKQAGTAIFIGPNDVTAILDFHTSARKSQTATPGWGDHLAVLLKDEITELPTKAELLADSRLHGTNVFIGEYEDFNLTNA